MRLRAALMRKRSVGELLPSSRGAVVAMCCACTGVTYSVRAALSVAIVPMARPPPTRVGRAGAAAPRRSPHWTNPAHTLSGMHTRARAPHSHAAPRRAHASHARPPRHRIPTRARTWRGHSHGRRAGARTAGHDPAKNRRRRRRRCRTAGQRVRLGQEVAGRAPLRLLLGLCAAFRPSPVLAHVAQRLGARRKPEPHVCTRTAVGCPAARCSPVPGRGRRVDEPVRFPSRPEVRREASGHGQHGLVVRTAGLHAGGRRAQPADGHARARADGRRAGTPRRRARCRG